MSATKTSFRSLKATLIFPYVFLIILLTITIGLLSYWAGSNTVSRLSERLSLEMVERIGQAVDHHMYGSSAVLEAAFPVGLTASDDISSDLNAMRTRFWTATTLHTDPNDYVYYGNIAGQAYGLKRLNDKTAEIRIKTDALEPRRYFHLSSINGTAAQVSTESSIFDPRTRPWFSSREQNSNRHMWTSVYVDFSTQDLVVTRARQVLSHAGSFTGVVATDVSLLKLNHFISDLEVSENGLAFLVESNGELLAASNVPNIQKTADGKMQRMTVDDAGDELIKATYKVILPEIAKHQQTTATGTVTFIDPSGEKINVAYKHITDNAGLDWIAVTAVPNRDILKGVTQQVYMVLILGLIAVVIAVLLGLIILMRFTRDISSLAHAVMDNGTPELSSLTLQRSDEIGVLARSLVEMRRDLLTDSLTGTANRAALEIFVSKLLKVDDQAPIPYFALLFIDLDNFKPLNDQYGHHKGDDALIEVAQRFEALMRPHDLLARIGGDEFVVVLTDNIRPLSAEIIKQRFEDALIQPLACLLPNDTLRLHASIGVAIYPEEGRDLKSLLKAADMKMYAVKNDR
ncbi:sensor domain-containing diguanylate cyclase [Neptunomonas qingdaonensis]|uniref:Diguanylate cyclase (GGDEF) domain-containing protein n=1 Tax=Neptunomonas qingdaonensis TaxID=1045558 RepID=A0A1I2U8T3_9GAMM|nr:sensor domain-containing diguanylate cyclase [Neptunomonas qingdaonensis]SFG73433.1 diguanylate cyclase (GGDEF) domain-containing protein [Neptunomonas qingdaonensis]